MYLCDNYACIIFRLTPYLYVLHLLLNNEQTQHHCIILWLWLYAQSMPNYMLHTANFMKILVNYKSDSMFITVHHFIEIINRILDFINYCKNVFILINKIIKLELLIKLKIFFLILKRKYNNEWIFVMLQEFYLDCIRLFKISVCLYS